MKYDKLCVKCSGNPDFFTPDTVYEEVPADECPRCKEKWVVRFAMVSWQMFLFGGAITLAYMFELSHKWAVKLGVADGVCNYVWVVGFVIGFWFMTSSLGKLMAKKAGLIENDTSTGEWDFE